MSQSHSKSPSQTLSKPSAASEATAAVATPELHLRYQTPLAWARQVLENFDSFLQDHAAAEKKASGMAMSMASHYPDKPELVTAMIDLAIEELYHFREVVKLLHADNLQQGNDSRDDYVAALRKCFRKQSDHYLLDRLLVGAVIEARGAERFGLVAQALEPGPRKDFYEAITASEARHYELFLDLATRYFSLEEIRQRLDTLLDIEADIVAALPWQPALH